MLKLYEKVPKSLEFIYGSRLIDEDKNPFLEGPCLLCISGKYNNEKEKNSNFGIAKEGMRIARLRVKGQKNAGFNLNDFPIKFLAIQNEKNNENETIKVEQIIAEFVNKYFYPLIEKDGNRLDSIEAMKNMRNVNIMSYCKGTMLAKIIEIILMNKMRELGYTDEECKKIQSQMCIFSISSDVLKGGEQATWVSFTDINDMQDNANITQIQKQEVLGTNIGEKVFNYSDNEIIYMFNGDGEHNLKKYTQNSCPMTVCLSSAISKALENSIQNKSSQTFIPINAEQIIADFKNIMQKVADGEEASELMKELDNKLVYGGAKRISKEELELMDQIDEMLERQIKLQSDNITLSKQCEILKKKVGTIEKNSEKELDDEVILGNITMQDVISNAISIENTATQHVASADNIEQMEGEAKND